MNSKLSCRRALRPGFTLIELMVVVAILGLLATLTLMGFRYAQVSAMRNRTTAFHKAIMSGLENYKSDFGEYPRPKKPGTTSQIKDKTYVVGGALMLYQAMSGDGDSSIDTANPTLGPSTGRMEGDKTNNVELKEMPKEMWTKDTAGYMLVDGFGHPFQYAVPSIGSKVQYGQDTTKVTADTINNTYDLWSFGDDTKNTAQITLQARRNEMISGKWIKNW